MIKYFFWLLCGIPFMVYGMYIMLYKEKKVFGFWSNVDIPKVKDIKKFNEKLSRVIMLYGIGFMFCMYPIIFAEQNDSSFIIIMIGIMFLNIITMASWFLYVYKE